VVSGDEEENIEEKVGETLGICEGKGKLKVADSRSIDLKIYEFLFKNREPVSFSLEVIRHHKIPGGHRS
jgi:hypothetical protein